jgi:hypothetical protein
VSVLEPDTLPAIRRYQNSLSASIRGANIRFLLLLLSIIALASCSADRAAAYTFYVVIRPNEAAQFVAALMTIAEDDGMETAVSRVTSDTGNVLNVLEARGHGLQLWAQNTPLSGDEDQKLCGVHSGSYSDPAQFTVFTVQRFFGSRAAARELGERVLSQLQKLRFNVRLQPAVCGEAVIRERS